MYSAKLNNAGLSAQKVRKVASLIRGFPASQAYRQLSFQNQKSAFILKKLIGSAIANAENNFGVDSERLVIHQLEVNEAKPLKRIMARAKGRANRILKKNCHIVVGLILK